MGGLYSEYQMDGVNTLAHDKRDDAIENILQELRQKEEAAAPVSSDALDEIMSGLGYGSAPAAPRQQDGREAPSPKSTPPKRQASEPVKARREEPRDARPEPPPAPFSEKKERKSETSIWDIEVESGPSMRRTGKAAALDLVQEDKFADDEELARWFEGGGSAPSSKKEQRRADKLRKKQEAEARRQQKEQTRQLPLEDGMEPREEPWEAPRQEEPRYTEEYLREDKYYYEEPYVEQPAPQMPSPPLYDEGRYGPPPVYERPLPEDDRRFFTMEQIDERGRPRGVDEFADGAFFDTEDGPVRLQWNPVPLPPVPTEPPMQEDLLEGQPGYQRDDEGYYTQTDMQIPQEVPSWRTPPGEDVVTGSAYEDPWNAPWPEENVPLSGVDEMAALQHTQSFDIPPPPARKTPSAAYTQEFPLVEGWEPTQAEKSLYVDEMVDDKFRAFFSETVSVEQDEVEHGVKKTEKKARRRRRRQFTTGEFAKLGEEVDEQIALAPGEEYDEYEEYNRPQDAPAIEGSIFALLRSLRVRFFVTLGLGLLLLWFAFSAADMLPLPAFVSPTAKPLAFSLVYLVLVLVAVGFNFSTVAPGIVGLVTEPTVDSPPALAALAALLQAVVVFVQMLTGSPLNATLFGGVAALLLAGNAFGKQIRAASILDNFQLSSAGAVHSAAYVLDTRYDEAYEITRGLEEGHPAMLVSRPTALMKGFMRQSFSPRRSDRTGRILAWILLGVGLLAAGVTYLNTKELFSAVSAFAAALCLGAPFTSSIVSGLPSLLLQRGASHVGAVVPGWSAIEELGEVNVVMAGGRDLFPPSDIRLHGLRAFEMQNINNAILYAASVVVQGCDTLQDIFLALVNSRPDTLFKCESLIYEPGRGYTAWVDEKRIVLGNREMMQKHDIALPSIEEEMKYVQGKDRRPLYLAVSGTLYGMFVVGYSANEEVQATLDSLIRSGVSLLVSSNDMNITDELIEDVYDLPRGFIKVLGIRELEMLEPLTSYLDESEGVMSHVGTFASFIGGMRAAASCAAAERMGSILQVISVGFCCLLSVVLAIVGGLSGISIFPVLLCQLAWSIVALAIPFGQKY